MPTTRARALVSSEISPSPDGRDGHVFNDDLLANSNDSAKARELFPRVMHILEHADLITLFREIDVQAGAAKWRTRMRGVLVVLFGSSALVGASVSPLIHHEGALSLVAFVSAAAGLFSVLVGVNGLFGVDSKSKWLRKRFQTERLRQFHFQAFVCRAADLVNSLEGNRAIEEFKRERIKWFRRLKSIIVDGRDAMFEGLMHDVGESDIWLYDKPSSGSAIVESPLVDELFSAYRWLRIEHQHRYASYKMSESERGSARAQLVAFGNAGVLGLASLVVIHLFVAMAIAWRLFEFVPPVLWLPPVWLHVVIMLVAIGALTVAALNEGLRPARELERYQNYRVRVRGIRDRFENAESFTEKLEVMKDMERISFYEMRDFLKTHNDAKFIL